MIDCSIYPICQEHGRGRNILIKSHVPNAIWRREKMKPALRFSRAVVTGFMAGLLENRSSSVDFLCVYGLPIVDFFRKQWQATECINCQKYHDQPTKAKVDCYVSKWVCN